ncbi:MAG: hypothetical protein CSA42_02455 [Gammaproteobacteria bacterium]|nr:MAG: hypothetical protein CSA42_02455 [Gammaproteobacteria bacterium]
MFKTPIFRKLDYLIVFIIRKYLKFSFILWGIFFASVCYGFFYATNTEDIEYNYLETILKYLIPYVVFIGFTYLHIFCCTMILIKTILEPSKFLKRIYSFFYSVFLLLPTFIFLYPSKFNYLLSPFGIASDDLGLFSLISFLICWISLFIHKQKAKRNNEELFY